jgi:hypothetical protein
MIRVQCPQCDKKLGLDDSFAGRLGQCPACGQKFRIPGAPVPAPAPAPTVKKQRPEVPAERLEEVSSPPRKRRPEEIQAAPPRPKPPRPDDEVEELVEVAEEAPPRKKRPQQEIEEAVEVVEGDQADADEPARPKKKKKKRKKQRVGIGEEFGEFMIPLMVIIGLWLVLTLVTFFVRPAMWGLLIGGGVIAAMGRRWFLRIAYEEGLDVWLMCLLVPFYQTYFFFTRISQMLKPFLLSTCGFVFFLTGGAFWLYGLFHDHVKDNPGVVWTGGPAENLNDVDAECQELLRGPNTAEALEWLKGGGDRRQFSDMDKEEAIQTVKEAYDLGAVRVTLVNIHKVPGQGDRSSQMVIELPREAAKRRALLKWEADLMAEDNPEPDHGQKYLLYDRE